MKSNYELNLLNVQKYILANLANELDLTRLAKIGFISPFHFHRIFKSFFGFTPIDYLERVRINAAIHLLKYTKLSIADISFEVGFKNPETFNRSFKKITGNVPRKIRIERVEFELESNTIQRLEKSIHLKKIKIQKLDYVYLNQKINKNTFGSAYRRLFDLGLENKILNEKSRIINIWNYNKFLNYTSLDLGIILKEQCRYPKMLIGSIKEISYLEFEFNGSFEDFELVYNYIFNEIIFKKGFHLKPKPIIEIFEKFPPFYYGKNCISKILVPIE